MAIGIIGILAHQGVLGKKVLDSLKKIPNSIGGKDLVLEVSIVLVGLPPIVLLICIAKSKRDVAPGYNHGKHGEAHSKVHKYEKRLKVTPKNIDDYFEIGQKAPTVWTQSNCNAMISRTSPNEYVLSIHYQKSNDESVIHHKMFTIDENGTVRTGFQYIYPETGDGRFATNTVSDFDSFIRETIREINFPATQTLEVNHSMQPKPLKSLIFQGPNAPFKSSRVVFPVPFKLTV